MVQPTINDPTKEIGYLAQRSGLFVAGKQSAEVLGETFGKSIEQSIGAETAKNISTAAGAIKGVGGLVTIGLAAAVSAGLTQMDFVHRTDNLKDLYKEELSAKLKKPIDKLLRSDLDELGKSNEVIREEMARSRKQRNFGVALSFIASMASLAVITLALPAALGALTTVGTAVAAEAVLGTVGGFALKAAVGLLTYHVVKDPLHYVADKLFGIDEKTTNDYIVNIKRDREQGKIISREQVLSVFAAANPEVDKYIAAEYGKPFDDLSIEDKQRASKELNNHIPLEKLTVDINSGKVNVSELAFAAEGQISGVNHEKFMPAPPKPGLIGKVMAGVGTMLGLKKSYHKDKDHELAVSAVAMASAMIVDNDIPHHSKVHEKGFVTTVGLAKHDTKLGHVEHLEKSRSEAAMNVGIPGQ